MVALVASTPLIPGGCHSTEIDYVTFLRGFVTSRTHADNLRKIRARFVRLYPSLDTWFAAPLVERVGNRERSSGDAYKVALARPYLYFLACSGLARLDWPWIFAINFHVVPDDLLPPEVKDTIRDLSRTAQSLGCGESRSEQLRRALKYFCLNRGKAACHLSETDLEDFEAHLVAFEGHPERGYFFDDDRWQAASLEVKRSLFLLRKVLYHRGAITEPPKKWSPGRKWYHPLPQMEALIERYAIVRQAQGAKPGTVCRFRAMLRHFADWLRTHCPEVTSFADLNRDHVEAYASSLETLPDATPSSLSTRRGRLGALSVFFHDITAWEWEGSPNRPLINVKDLPRVPTRLPRYIPSRDLDRLMRAVHHLQCPYQRSALIIARWSGARRSEIRNLELNCLDSYPDGTPRLHIPVGKTNAERLIPIHPEAGEAIRLLQSLASPDQRGFAIVKGGPEVRRLFVHKGRHLSVGYLFSSALEIACTEADLLEPDGSPSITAHRFRHTVGTQLAEGGARLHTIMRMLGHSSTGMTLVYAHVSDVALREDYEKVLAPGARIAGPLSDQLRTGAMPQASLDWIKANFFRTELELGHCLRLPEEGPCECDLYLTCAKFVTTPEYAPRLRARRVRELDMIEDALQQGWTREVERHQCTVRRIEELLLQLGEELVDPKDPVALEAPTHRLKLLR
jgi:integrase